MTTIELRKHQKEAVEACKDDPDCAEDRLITQTEKPAY